MSINIYSTQTMMAALSLMPARPTFLRDRYFPTSDQDIFVTEEVLVEYKDDKKRLMAPVVLPRVGGIPVARDGYKTNRVTAPYVAPERPLTVDDLKKKAFGETLFSQKSPAEREAAILKQDLEDLNAMIDTREEYMAAETLFNNGYTLQQIGDTKGTKADPFDIHFYSEVSNPAIYTPSASWDAAGNDVLMDLYYIASSLKKRGLQAADVLFGADVAEVLLKNEAILNQMDNRRLDLWDIKPTELPEGVTNFGRVNAMGVMLSLLCYTEEYVADNGTSTTFIPANKIAVTAPACGRTLYGAVTQLEESTRDFATYAAKRVPHITTDAHGSIRTLAQKARPLTVPNYANCSISATVLF